MKHDPKKVITIALTFLGLLIISCLVAWASIKVADHEYRIDNLESQSKSNPVLDVNTLSKQLASLINIPVAKDGENGSNGKNGENGTDGRDGKDSVSTNTIVEKETTVIQPVPGQDGRNGLTPILGVSLDNVLLYKYENDRFWRPIPKINITVGQ